TEVEAYLNGKETRFTLTGPAVLVTPEAYTVIALVVHELATNSAKYGSLCDRSGRVDVTISKGADGDLSIRWRERGGPPVQPPRRRGFGSTIIERSIPFELKGTAQARFQLAGFEADFTIPQHYVSLPEPSGGDTLEESNPGSASAFPQFTSAPAGPDRPEHVLVVEDSMIIALDVEDNLRRLGVVSIDVASSVAGALAAIAKRAPDLAIVDFNLGVESSEPVMAELVTRGIPFVLATGYAELGNKLDHFGAQGIIRKPYGRPEIANVLETHRNSLGARLGAAPDGVRAKRFSVNELAK
ncbi:MAG: response regulator, partial [Pseudomonadota bacterium]